MKYKLSVNGHFSAAHALRHYKGKCENLHGHNWKVKVSLTGNILNKTGMVVDFTDIKSALRSVLAKLDHTCLNKLRPFNKLNPTAENIAGHIFISLKKKSGISSKICEVEVWESETSSVSVTD